MLKVAIIGASGYTGGELLRLLGRHPSVEVTAVTSEQSAGKPVTDLFPNLPGMGDRRFEPFETGAVLKKADFFFLALPHTRSMTMAAALLQNGKKAVDLSADFRLRDPAVFERTYQTPHADPGWIEKAVYGLPERYRNSIQKAVLVANPGCFPTGALLGLLPLVSESLIQPDGIVIDAKSGISGAGRSPKVDYHFPEVNESALAYNVTTHRHRPEINQELSALHGRPVQAAFTPHLIPMTRGILTTIYAVAKENFKGTDWVERFEIAYKNEPFVNVLPFGKLPATAAVRGSNTCQIGLAPDPATGRVIVVTAIDNLLKGASGQAVQNMNLMMGFEETLGLDSAGLFP
jgi:N-acetyl-gamma-glutamyl-phosphate reductase